MEREPVCVLPATAIATAVEALAQALRTRWGTDLVLLGVLKGAALFCADLVRAVGGDARLSFVAARSYGAGTVSAGAVHVTPPAAAEVAGARVVICDTIVDTGRTLLAVREAVRQAGAAAVHSCVLLDKRSRREVAIDAEFVAYVIADRFVVGYGLDHDGRHRGRADLAVIDGGPVTGVLVSQMEGLDV